MILILFLDDVGAIFAERIQHQFLWFSFVPQNHEIQPDAKGKYYKKRHKHVSKWWNKKSKQMNGGKLYL
jgi:hypothetical protein